MTTSQKITAFILVTIFATFFFIFGAATRAQTDCTCECATATPALYIPQDVDLWDYVK